MANLQEWRGAPTTINASEAADLVGVEYHSVCRWIKEGRLNAWKNGREWVILKRDAFPFSKIYQAAVLRGEKLSLYERNP